MRPASFCEMMPLDATRASANVVFPVTEDQLPDSIASAASLTMVHVCENADVADAVDVLLQLHDLRDREGPHGSRSCRSSLWRRTQTERREEEAKPAKTVTSCARFQGILCQLRQPRRLTRRAALTRSAQQRGAALEAVQD